MARPEVEVPWRRRVEPAGLGRDPAHLGRRPDLLDRQTELGGDVGRGGAGEPLPRLAPLGERRERDVDEQHGVLAERLRLAPRAPDQH